MSQCSSLGLLNLTIFKLIESGETELLKQNFISFILMALANFISNLAPRPNRDAQLYSMHVQFPTNPKTTSATE
jgi:hypothetical protein